MNYYEYTGIDPRFSKVFDEAMFNYTTLGMKNFLETYKGFHDVKVVVDVAGGIGATLNLITSNYPTIKGINFDLSRVIQNAPLYPGMDILSKYIFSNGISHFLSNKFCNSNIVSFFQRF